MDCMACRGRRQYGSSELLMVLPQPVSNPLYFPIFTNTLYTARYEDKTNARKRNKYKSRIFRVLKRH